MLFPARMCAAASPTSTHAHPRRLLPFGAHGVEAAYVNNGAAVGLQLGDAEALVARGPGLLSPLQQALCMFLGDLTDAPIYPQLAWLRAELVPQA